MSKLNLFQGFLRSPLEVGTMIPSQRYLVNKVLDQVVQHQPASLIEFGAGTGVFTRELDQYAQKKESLFLIFEKDEQMRQHLTEQYAHHQIFGDALRLPEVLKELGQKKVDCIVCGLPFSLFPKQKTAETLNQVYTHLNGDGVFILYQYSTHLRKRLKEQFDEVRTELILLNLPPIILHICRKRESKSSD